MDEAGILIIGADGQLGTALKNKYPSAGAVDVGELDIATPRRLRLTIGRK